MRVIKIRAARGDRKLKELIAALLRKGMVEARPAPSGHRVRLPLVQCAHGAPREADMTPDRVADVLIKQEAGGDAIR